MLGLGLSICSTAVANRLRQVAFPGKSMVLLVNGDSQGRGTADDQATSSLVTGYTPTAKVKIWSGSAWVTYQPGVAGASGMKGGSNGGVGDTGSGSELGFIKRWLAKYPNDTLYVLKYCQSGSFAGRGAVASTFTASIASGILIPTAGATPLAGYTLTGSSVPAKTYITFPQTAPNWYLGMIGATAYTGGDQASQVMSQYNGILSWSPTKGMAYNGNSNRTDNAFRAYELTALASLASPQIVAQIIPLGTNDMSNTTSAAEYQTELTAFITQERGDLPLAGVPIIVPRVMNKNADSVTVRNAMATMQAASLLTWVDMDAQALSADSTHWRSAGLDYLGSSAFTLAGL